MTTTRSMRSGSVESFYTAPSSFNSTNELSPVINLNGKSYYLTVYHKKPGSDWKEITQDYLKLVKKSDFQEVIQQTGMSSSKKIEIQTSICPKTNSICCNIQNEKNSKIEVSLTKSQSAKIFRIFEKIRGLKNILDSSSSSLSKESLETLNSSFIKMSLEEIKTKRIHDYLEEANTGFNRHEDCDQNSIESPNKKARLEYSNKPEPIHETLDSSSIKMSPQEVKTERVNDCLKPVGFQNKSMNCGFNSCLQMIVNEPALLHIYTTVANYYANSTEVKDKECGNWMLSVLDSYDQAIKKQKPIPAEVSNQLRLAIHYLNPKTISSRCNVQEDASEILMLLFAKNDNILKKQSLINTSSINYKFENIIHYQSIKDLKEMPHKDCSSLNPDNTYKKERTNYGIKINFDSKQKNFSLSSFIEKCFFDSKQEKLTLSSLLKKYFCDEEIGEGSDTCRYLVNGIYTEVSPVKEEIKFDTLPKDLYINFARFKADRTKFTNPIEIPEQLDAKLLNVKDSPSGSYELSSFIVHLGSSLNGGHYMAYRKVQDQWIEFNDGCVSLLSKEQALEAAKNSYICFYRLRGE